MLLLIISQQRGFLGAKLTLDMPLKGRAGEAAAGLSGRGEQGSGVQDAQPLLQAELQVLGVTIRCSIVLTCIKDQSNRFLTDHNVFGLFQYTYLS